MKRPLVIASIYLVHSCLLPTLFIFAIAARFKKKRIQIGLGGMPLINNVYHKRALLKKGYSVETFTRDTYYITNNFDKIYDLRNRFLNNLFIKVLNFDFIIILFRYKCIYTYFNGVLLGSSRVLWRFEPLLLKIARVKLVLMPYGGDIQSTSLMTDLNFKSLIQKDYPKYGRNSEMIIKKKKLWQKNANHIIAGCNWVQYLDYWDTLCLSHFAIDLDSIKPIFPNSPTKKPLRILHAPNHRNVKGTSFILDCCRKLSEEGYSIELVLIERKSNEEVMREIEKADVVVDQLIIGWYAMFAIEAMAHGKPVLCHLNDNFVEMFVSNCLLNRGELPIINTNTVNLYSNLKWCLEEANLNSIGMDSRRFVEKFHSTDVIGEMFDSINSRILHN